MPWVVAGGAPYWPDPYPVTLGGFVRITPSHPWGGQSPELPVEVAREVMLLGEPFRSAGERPWYGVEAVYRRPFLAKDADLMLKLTREFARFASEAAAEAKMRLDFVVKPESIQIRASQHLSRFNQLDH